jgi:hypothetical protein
VGVGVLVHIGGEWWPVWFGSQLEKAQVPSPRALGAWARGAECGGDIHGGAFHPGD